MGVKRELWDSTVGIKNYSKSAPQISPSVAKMYTEGGVAKIGAAIFDIGEKLHQVNVTRQVAKAMAEYKMKETDFLMRMQTADPSTTDFGEEYAKFAASHAGLSEGVSRDAANIIGNKLTTAGASTYGTIKRMELRNAQEMALAEIPDVIDGLVREQVQAEMSGDKSRAERAKQDFNQYMTGLKPVLSPGKEIAIKAAYDDAVDKARPEAEKQAIARQMMIDPSIAEEMITGAKYLKPTQQLTLSKAAKAAQTQKDKKADLQQQAHLDEQSGQMLDQMKETGDVLSVPEMDEDLIPATDAVYDAVAAGGVPYDPDDIHPIYYQYKDVLKKLGNKNPFISDTQLWEAQSVLPQVLIDELRAESALNEKIFPKRDQVITHMTQIGANFRAMVDTVNSFDDTDIALLLKKELRHEQKLIIKEMKEKVSQNESHEDVEKWLNLKFEGKSDNILKNAWQRKVMKPGWREEDYEDRMVKGTRRIKRQGVMNLLRDKKNWEREIEAITPEWFKGDIVPVEPPEPSKPREKVEQIKKIEDIKSGRITDDEFIEWVENARRNR
jgi:hypothetical protein